MVSRINFLIRMVTNCDGSINIGNLKGLYSLSDMRKGITWAEVAYLLFYVAGMDKIAKWSSIVPDSKYSVSVIQKDRVLSEELGSYKGTSSMEDYIVKMARGERYIPLPLYCAYSDFLNHPVVSELNLSLEDMFKRVSEEKLGSLL